MCVYICIVHLWMVAISNPGTYGTRKCRSWRPDIHRSKDHECENPKIQNFQNPKIQKSKIPKFQNSKIPKFQKSKNAKIQISKYLKIQKSKTFHMYGILQIVWCSFGFLHFGMFCCLEFLDFWSLGVLGFTVVFPICRSRSKIGFGNKQRLCRYLQCF